MVFCFDVTGQDTTTLETRKIKKLREENLETLRKSHFRVSVESSTTVVLPKSRLCFACIFFVLRCGVVHFLVLVCFSIPNFECNF